MSDGLSARRLSGSGVSSSSQAVSNTLSKPMRLLDKAQFSNVFEQAPIRVSHPSLLILAKPNTCGHARLGLVVAKKQIRLAVRRNRIKRLIRERFRLQQLPAIDVIVLPRSSADKLENSAVKTILNGLFKRVRKKQLKLVNEGPISGDKAK